MQRDANERKQEFSFLCGDVLVSSAQPALPALGEKPNFS